MVKRKSDKLCKLGGCKANRISDSEYCFFHDPTKKSENREAKLKGCKTSHSPVPKAIVVSSLSDLQAFLSNVLVDLQDSRSDSISRARAKAYVADIYLKTYEKVVMDERLKDIQERLGDKDGT